MASRRVVTLRDICRETRERGFVNIETVVSLYRDDPDVWIEAPSLELARELSYKYPWNETEMFERFRLERARGKELSE